MKTLLLGAALAVGLGLAAQANAAESSTVKAGTLTCDEAGGWGYIIGSSRALHCTFSNDAGTVKYEGKISKFGADIGYQHSGVLIWAVLAPTGHPAPGALEGTYAGATAGVSVGVGAGANVLVGGSGNTISLQPLSVEGTTGLNVAAGIGAITLKYHPGD